MKLCAVAKYATNDETNAKMQKKMAQEQEKLKEERVAGTAGGGMVTVTVTGHKEVVDVEIKEEAVDPEDVDASRFSIGGYK